MITGGVWNPTSADYATAGGDNGPLPSPATGSQTGYIYLSQFDDGNPQPLGGSVTTTNSLVTISSLTRYTLTVALGNSLTFENGDALVQILLDGNVVESLAISAGEIPNGTFKDFSTFVETTATDPSAGSGLTVRIIHSFGGMGERELEFDNVRLDAQVIPEPSTGTVALLGLVLLLPRRAR